MIDLRVVDFPSDTPILLQMSRHVETAAITGADELGVFAALRDGPRSAARLARDLSLREDGLVAVLRALVVARMLFQDGEGFALTPAGRAYWDDASPLYRAAVFEYMKEERPHRRLVRAMREGGGDNGITEMWEQGEVTPETAVAFTRLMHSMALAPSIAAVRSGAFTGVRHVIDVGGGSGAFCAAFVSHLEGTKATLMDLPPVCEVGVETISRYTGTAAVDVFPCDFFRDPWPDHGDAFFFGNVVHDWRPNQVRSLLASCFAALPAGGRIFIHELLLDEDKVSPPVAVYFNVMMYLNHGSQQFAATELYDLLTEVGFSRPEIVHRFGDYSLIQAWK